MATQPARVTRNLKVNQGRIIRTERQLGRLGAEHRRIEAFDDGQARGAAAVFCVDSHPSLCEAFPDGAFVRAACQDHVGEEDVVASVQKAWLAGLELEGVRYQLEHEVVAAASRVEIRIEAVVVQVAK